MKRIYLLQKAKGALERFFRGTIAAFAVSLALMASMLVLTNTVNAQITIGVANTPTVVNTYAPVTNIIGTTVTIGASTGFAHTFAVGNKVLIAQMTGSVGVNGGKFEFADVTAVSGSNITLSMLLKSYSFATEKVQLIWVPYDPISITTLANILAQPWNGTTGGIVCVWTDGTLTLGGSVVADETGFKGSEAIGAHIWGEGVYGGGGAGNGGGGGYGANTSNASGVPADYDGGGGGGSTKGGGGPGGVGNPPANAFSKYGAGGSKSGSAGISIPQGGGTGSPSGTDGTFGGGGGGGGATEDGGKGGKYGGGGAGGVGAQGGGPTTTATYNGGAPFATGINQSAGGGGGGVGGGGGGGGTGHHSGSGGGGASPSQGGCGGSITNFAAGGIGAIFGVGATNGQRATQQGFGCGHAGGGGGMWTGGGGGGGGFSFQQNGGGGGGGFKPATGYHSFFNCDANGTCADPRIWMGGGAPGGGKGGGIAILKAGTIVTNAKKVIANGGNGVHINDVAYAGGGGGMVLINVQNISGSPLDICAQGGNGVKGTEAGSWGYGSSGGGGGGVIWVNDAAGSIGNNLNSTAQIPTVPGMTFCMLGGLGGLSTFNGKDATYGGSGGCGGAGVVQVNPNDEIFCTSATINYAISTPDCNTFDVDLMLSGGQAPYTVDWQDLAGTNDPEDRTGLPYGLGYYLVKVTTSLGCISQKTVNVGGCDYGDLPDNNVAGPGSYPTNLSNGGEGVGPSHLIIDGLKLGAFIDHESDGQQSPLADGDGFDDDGVTLPMFLAGQTATVPVTFMNMTNAAAKLTMFIDFNGDGDFADAGEMYSTTVAINATTASFSVPVPITAVLNTNIGVRFRLSKDMVGSMVPTGLVQSGEVEDYIVQVMGFDHGDLADTGAGTGVGNYQTQNSDNGPIHKIVTGLKLGASVDAEADGQQNATASGDGADENGVTFPMLIADETATVPVTVMNMTGNSAKLTAFFDWNKDGDFTDAGEMVSITVPDGTNGTVNLSVPIPSTTVLNTDLGVRVRLSTDATASMLPTGSAPDGEVEDYLVQVMGFDRGDLPDTGAGIGMGNYETLIASGGPNHKIVTDAQGNVTLKIGTKVDAEKEGQPSAMGSGDDSAPLGGMDDEDGVTFPALIITGMPATFGVTVMNMTGQPAKLAGFFDWNNDGDFNDLNEMTSQIVPTGTNGVINLTVVPPTSISLLNTGYGTRFRISTDQVAAMNPNGAAPDGEVEDYVPIAMGYDYGDLPDNAAGTSTGNYQTLLSDNGPRHKIITDVSGNVTLKIGGMVDDDADGQPSANASGDNLEDANDEDGIPVFPLMIISQPVTIQVPVMNMTTSGANLYTFIDFNKDGDFSDPSETLPPVAVPAGTNGNVALNFTVPSNAVMGMDLGFRIRISTATGVAPTGLVPDGEVEDYMVQVAGYDYGDLPNTYGTTDPTGAKHAVSPTLMLGNCVDAEINGQPEPMAGMMTGGDDNTVGVISFGVCTFADDENGIEFVTPLVAGSPACIKVTALNNTGGAAILQAWIDFNGDGDMLDAGEQLNTLDFAPAGATIQNGGVSNQLFCFNVPANATFQGGSAFVRFRLSTAGNLQPNTGIALNGEIEDYKVSLAKVGNFVWDDTNGNGLQDAGEPGINNVTVKLIWGGVNNIIGDGDDQVYTTVTSNMGVNGMYMFPGLFPGNYNISVPTNPVGGFVPTFPDQGGNDAKDSDVPTGITFAILPSFGLPLGENGTGDAPGVQFPDAQENSTFDFGYYIPPSIGDFVFNDWNNNGTQQTPGDGVIQGVTVTLTGTNGIGQPVSLTTTTSVNGNYLFNNLAPGTYKLTFATPPNFYTTLLDQGGNDAADSDVDPAMGGMTITEVLTSGENNLTYDAGYYSLDFGDLPQTYGTSGLATGPQHVLNPNLFLGTFVDAELDGQPEAMAGAMTGGDDNNATSTTYGTPGGSTDDENGITFVTPLIPGSQACIKVTAVNTTGAAAILQGWIDFDGNGSFQPAEQLTTLNFAPSGASIPNGGVVDQLYCFTVPITATYQGLGAVYARFRLSPTGNLAPNTGRAIGGEIEDYKVALAKIGSMVWNDNNNDGIQNEPGTNGLNGINVQLVWAGPDANLATVADNVTYSITTSTMGGVSGQYMFVGLLSGTYNLSVPTNPLGFIPTQVNQGANDIIDADIPTGIVIVVPLTMNFPLNENGTGDTPGQQFPDAQDDLTYDFGFVSVDYGDLPNTYGTDIAGNGPKQIVNPNLKLGASVDGELNGQPEAMAGMLVGGDDNNNGGYNEGGAGDDENGITFLTPMIPGFQACVRVNTMNTLGGNAVLQAWIDFNGDGDVTDAGEQLNTGSFAAAAPGAIVPAGASVNSDFCFDVPAAATFFGGNAFVRFRLSPTGGLAFNGPAAMPYPIGEVEDYKVQLAKAGNLVWIDANVDGLQTQPLEIPLGINNVTVELQWAGPDGNFATVVDNRTFTDVTATENGVQGKYLFCGLIPGNYKMVVPPFGYVPTLIIDAAGNTQDVIDADNPVGVLFTVSNPPTNAPINENGIGDNPLVINGFPDNQANFTFDFGYLGFDFGDLPDSYGTTQGAGNPGPDGAVHTVTPDLYLGPCVDIDIDGQPEPMAGFMTGGDDGNAGPGALGTCTPLADDENGISFPTPLIPGNSACVKVTARNNTGGAAFLQAWIDFNGNGTFEAAEQLTTGNFAPAGASIPNGGVTNQNFCFDVPVTATFNGGNLFARFRLSKNGGVTATGPAIPGNGQFPNGEVEDYKLPLALIGNYVWMDNPDIEGDQDASEMPLANVKINLTWAGEDGVFQTATNSGVPAGDDRVYMTFTDASGRYEFRGAIPSTNYRILADKYTAPNGVAGALINPINKILTIPNLPPNDNLDSDGAPFVGVSIPNLTNAFLPTAENGLQDNNALTGFPDNQTNLSIDLGFINEPRINAAMAVVGFDPTVCGEFAAFMDLCIKNTSTAPLASIQAMLDLASANAFGTAFKGMIGVPIIVASTAQQNPVINAGYTGAATAPGKNLFNGTSGLLWPGEQICIRVKFGVDPDFPGAPANPKAQAMVSAKAQNFQGVPIPDYWNGGAQYMAMDASDVGNNPETSNPGYTGDTGGVDDPTVLGNCWQTTQNSTICNDLVYVSMDADCYALVQSGSLLEGEIDDCDEVTYPLGGFFQITITTLNTNQPVPNPIPPSYAGQELKYSVKHIMSCNSCWGHLKLEDKLPPVMECSNIHLNCAITNYTPGYLENVLGLTNATPVVTDCSPFTLTHVDTWHDLACNEGFNGQPDLSAYVERIWTAKDSWNNVSTCIQYIYFDRLHVYDVHFPADAQVSCSNGSSDPSVTGVPYVEAFGIQWPLWPDAGFCELATGYIDDPIRECDGTTKILRTWKAIDWCLPTSPTPPLFNPLYFIQVVKVVDHEGPAMTCPANLTVGTDPFTCCATTNLPDIIIRDNCSRVNNIEAKVFTHEYYTGEQTGIKVVAGTVEDFPGNNWWDLDTLGNYGWTPCLPLGNHTVVYTAQDDCGNTATCSFELAVRDLVPPVAACDETTTVAIGPDDPFDCYTSADGCDFAGVTWVKASTFNDGSYDNCFDVKYTVRRMNPYSDCINNLEHDPCYPDNRSEFDLATAELDSIKFYCCEVGTTQTVILAVYQVDVNGNVMAGADGEPIKNECMIQVEVQDKLKPVCLPPAQVNVNCENFDPSLWAYGKPLVADNCCLDTSKVYQGQCGLTHTASYTLFDTVCNKGTITRTFRAFDCHGLSSQCTQRVIVTYDQDYFVKFPNDVIVTVCDGTGNYGEPSFFGEDCELLGVSYEDAVYTVVPDACFKIERTWQIINWCTYNPNLPCINVPNPNPNPIANASANLAGPTVSECGTLAPWAPTVVKINPTDAQATNFCTFWDKNANCYRYKQIIKIIDGQAPTGTFVTPACDNQNWLTANSNQLWNEPEWWDNGIGSHDLCEEPTDLCITGTDACSGSNINIEYLLFLDLDGDGVMETVINSVNTGIAGLGWNTVNYGNAQNPNFSGGTPRSFDERAVPFNQKWGFAIQETVVGNNKTACVRWNTQQAQNTFVAPELPHGTHKIKWLISDGCGNNKEYETTFTVKDCKAPTVVCLNGLSVNIMPTGMIQMWASDFLQYTEDNCTPSSQLKIGIRKCGAGTGFPTNPDGTPQTSVTFTCQELGTQCVELWSIDAAGNADYCETYVIVQDNLGNCPTSDHINVAGALKTEMTDGVEEATVNVNGTSSFTPPYAYFDLSDAAGVYQLMNNVPLDATFTIAPEKDDNPLNGVTTYDLVLISKHILGSQPFDSPYKMIAADANKSGSITTFDVVELRKLILGIYTELPNNTSWRFVDKSFQFPNLNNPFQTAFPEMISVAAAMNHQMGEDFAGVKIGDVNNTVVANATMQAEERTAGTALFDIEDRTVKAGETFEVTFKAAEALKGFQFTMLLDGLKAISTVNTDHVSDQNFNLLPEKAMAISIDGAQAFTVRFRAEKSGKLSSMLGVSGSITRAEAYPASAEGRQNIAFRFDGKTISGVGFELYQNQPNPFVNKTSIGFFLPEATEATLSIFDEAGRMVYQQKGQFAKGENMIALDRALLNTTGVLYYKLETATDSATRKMIQAK